MITNIRKNRLGTTSFDAQFPGMRKPQDFIVYPLKDEDFQCLKIQSATRIGMVNIHSGTVTLSRPKPNGAYFIHLNGAKIVGQLSSEELLLLKAQVFATAHGHAGTNGVVYTDNSGAIGVFN